MVTIVVRRVSNPAEGAVVHEATRHPKDGSEWWRLARSWLARRTEFANDIVAEYRANIDDVG